MEARYTEHAAALWRYALWLTDDRARARAEDVVQETLLRGWQHPEVFDDNERPPRPWLFRPARNVIINASRSSRFRDEVRWPEGSIAPERAGSDEGNAAMDRLLIADALAQLSPEHRAVVHRFYYRGWTSGKSRRTSTSPKVPPNRGCTTRCTPSGSPRRKWALRDE